jgi:hypothetical protein
MDLSPSRGASARIGEPAGRRVQYRRNFSAEATCIGRRPKVSSRDRSFCIMSKEQGEEFRREAEQPRTSLPAEFLDFLLHNKKWWLTPIILILLLVGLLVVLGGSGAAPFIYTLF